MTERYKDTIIRIKPLAEKFIIEQRLQYPLDTMNILEELNYYIIKSPAPTNLSGFYMKKDGFPFIFVNTNHTLGRQNFSLWHEVYHHIMNHENGISDFNSDSLQEREAEIFAGLVMLPDSEIERLGELDFADRIIIAEMSEHYQMSFSGILVRLMQAEKVNYDTYHSLTHLSKPSHEEDLQTIYRENGLNSSVILPTKNTQISKNIMMILEKNYGNNLVTGEKINEIISMIEGLKHE